MSFFVLLDLIGCRNHNTDDNRAVLLETLNNMSEESRISIDTFLDAGYASSYMDENNGPNSTVYWVEESIDSGFFISDYTGMIFEERNLTNKDLELIGSFSESKSLQVMAASPEALMEKAAQTNDMSPGLMKEIISSQLFK